MASSIINSDDGVVSGTSGLKTTGGNDGSLKIQANGVDAISIADDGTVSLAAGALPAASGGTGLTDPGTAGNVLTSNGTAWVSQAASSGVGYAFNKYTAPAPTTPGSFTWTKPAGLVGIRVIVASGGAGGSGARFGGAGSGGGGGIAEAYIPAPSIPGPVTVTVGAGGAGGPAPAPAPAPSGPSISFGAAGGTSSFGSFISITGGGAPGGPGTTMPTVFSGLGGGEVTLDPSVELLYQSYGIPGGPSGAFYMAGGGNLVPVTYPVNGTFDANQPLAVRVSGNPGLFPNPLGDTSMFQAVARTVFNGPFPSTPANPANSSAHVFGGHGAMLYGKWANGSNGFTPSGPPASQAGNPAKTNYGISAGGGGGYGSGSPPPVQVPVSGGNGGPGVIIVEEFY